MAVRNNSEDRGSQPLPVEYQERALKYKAISVLGLNVLALAVDRLSLPASLRPFLVFLIVVIDVLWISYALDAAWSIGKLKESNPVPSEADFRERGRKGRWRPSSTGFLSVVVPILFMIAWIVGLFVTLFFYTW